MCSSDLLEIGNLLEPLVQDLYIARTGYNNVENPVTIVEVVDNVKLIANIDAWVKGSHIVEYKTSSYKDSWGEDGSAEIPIDYIYQCAWYCEITGLLRAEIPVLFLDGEFRIYHYEHDSEFGNELIKSAVHFWLFHVEQFNAPEPSTTKEAQENWLKIVSRDMILSDKECENACTELYFIKDQIKQLEKREEIIKLKLMNFMKNKDTLMTIDGSKILATWGKQKRNNLDISALSAKYPEIVKEFRQEKELRSFILKIKGAI